MPYGRQITEEEQRQNRCVQVSEREASRQENQGRFEEQRIGGYCRNFASRAPCDEHRARLVFCAAPVGSGARACATMSDRGDARRVIRCSVKI